MCACRIDVCVCRDVWLVSCVCVCGVRLHALLEDPCVWGAGAACTLKSGFLRGTEPCRSAACWLTMSSRGFLGGNSSSSLSSRTHNYQIANLAAQSKNATESVLEACSREGENTQSNLINQWQMH